MVKGYKSDLQFCVEIVTHTRRELRSKYQVVIAAGSHLFPFRTEKLSPAATMILRETVGK